MPGLAQRNEQYSNASFGFWSNHNEDVSYNQLQKFWSEQSMQARQELLKIDKQTLFEQARKNMYCSRCNGLLLEGFLQIVMYGKSLQQEGVAGNLHYSRSGVAKNQSNGGLSMTNGSQDEIQDPSVHPWGGLTTTRDGSLTLLDCYLCSKSLKGLQNVFDSARARERERELLYPDACGGGGRGWITQGIASYGRGHGTRETCALHTARLSCDTLVDFWSALGEETRHSLLRMKEEDFIERLMYRFDSKRFCRDCRRNVIREFKELKELKRMRRETRCNSWFCVPDTAFAYEVSDNTVLADWSETFADTIGTYDHFEWAVGTGEGKTDIMNLENVGMNKCARVNDLKLVGLSACYITLRACKLDGRCSELSVKAHALKDRQCVHCRLVVGDGYVTVRRDRRGESIRRFFEHAEEAEEEEDDDSVDKDGNELDGECSRPQKHAKSPELAREFLLDAATVIFKEQVEKAFREGTARQNAHSIFVCLALKLLEDCVHVACKEIIRVKKQNKLLEEEEKEKRDEEERKERKKTKEREKKLRRKERLKEKEREKGKKCVESSISPAAADVLKEESSGSVEVEQNTVTSCRDSLSDKCDTILYRPGSPDAEGEKLLEGHSSSLQNHSSESPDEEGLKVRDGNGYFIVDQSKFSRRRLKFRKDGQFDQSLKWSDRRQLAVVSESASVDRSEPRYQNEKFEAPSSNSSGIRQFRISSAKSHGWNCGVKYSEKFQGSNNRNDRYDFYSCSCSQHNDYRAKIEPHFSATRVSREPKSVSKSGSTLDMSKQVYHGNKYNGQDYVHDDIGKLKAKTIAGKNPARDLLHSKKVWEPTDAQKKYPRSNSDTDITFRSSVYSRGAGPVNNLITSSGETCLGDSSLNSVEIEHGKGNKSRNSSLTTYDDCHMGPQDQCFSLSAAYEEVESCLDKTLTLNGSSHSIISSSSNSDNCFSSEGDSNTSFSNHGNLESSSTSDFEDASQQSDGRDTSVCIQNGFSEVQVEGTDKKQVVNGGVTLENQASYGHLPDGKGNKILENMLTKTAENSCNGNPAAAMSSQHQGIFTSVHNQHIQFPVYQTPSTVGYYHQNPVSWPATSANGLMAFPSLNPCVYTSPVGYGLNGNSPLCMPYGTLQHLATPVFNPGPVPAYQPVSKASRLFMEKQAQIPNPGTTKEAFTDGYMERIFPARLHPTEQAVNGEGKQNNASAKSSLDNTSFSLFHFGGPVALSTGCKSNPAPLKEDIVGELSSQFSADHVNNDHDRSKNETNVEEYNLFAASNGIRFSFF